MSMTSNTQKKWYEGLTAEEIEAVFAERERRNYAEIVAPILPEDDDDEDEHEVCNVCDECITCGGCGCDDDDED